VEEEEEETLRKSATEEEDIFGSSLVVFVRFSTLRRSTKMQKCLKKSEKYVRCGRKVVYEQERVKRLYAQVRMIHRSSSFK
jgi:hypothetical protein|tara:strand:- start:316 stop:558 length:243 start_codon:yes stop_codon:yes gene_type:complete